MRKLSGWILIGVLLLTHPLYGQTVDRIVAVVNGEIITLSDLNGAFEPYRKRIGATYRGPELEKVLSESKASLLRRLIDASLIEQEAKKTGISVKDEEVTAVIKDILSRKNISPEDFAKGLAEEGLSLGSYKKDMRDQLVRMKLIGREIKSKITVSDQEIGAYYSKHRADYEGKEAVRIKQILLPFPRGMDEGAKEKLKKVMEEILNRIEKGEQFDSLAAIYSQGPAGLAGGDLGFIEKGMMHREVEEVAFKLGKDEISGVILSPAGFHIIKAVDKRGAGLKPVEEVREEIRMKIEEEILDRKFEEWLEALRKKSHIEIKL